MFFDRFSSSLRCMPLIREALAAALCGFLLLPTHAAAPAWWIQRGVVDPDQLSDDFAVINQGQLKNLLKAAVSEMDAKLDGGAGTTLNSMVTGWETITGAEDDYAVVNIGQLKTVAKPVHERLLAVGLISSLPVWATALSASNEDFAAANIGQAKKLLSFDLDLDSDSDGLSDYREIVLGFDPHDEDTDGDGLPDGWEYYHGLDAQIATGNDGADGDPNNDGITNAQALAQNTHPNPIHFWIEHRYVSASIGMTGQIVTGIECSDPNKIPTESLDSKKPTEIQSMFNAIVEDFQINEGWLGAPDFNSGYFPLTTQTFHGGKGPQFYTLEEQTTLEGSFCTWNQFRLQSNRSPTSAEQVPSIIMLRYNNSSGSDQLTSKHLLTLEYGIVTLSKEWGQITEVKNGNEHLIPHQRVSEKVVLCPVEIRDDERILTSLPLKEDPWKNANIQQQVSDSSIAWITGNTGFADTPEMPKLSACLNGAPLALEARWRFECEYKRGNGYRQGYVADFTRPEDKVGIPTNHGGGYTDEMAASQRWQIYQSEKWLDELRENGFFGGLAKVFLKLDGEPEIEVCRFRIGGQNPDQNSAKSYIDSASGATYWYAYAIAKHETFGRVQGRFYNQFYTGYQQGPIGDNSVDMGLAAWAKSWPVYNLDRVRGTDGTRRQNGPGGYGMFQLTWGPKTPNQAEGTGSNAFIPRKMIWNWQENCLGAIQELQDKLTNATNLENALEGAYPAWPHITQTTYGQLNGREAIVLTYYNGMYGGQIKSVRVGRRSVKTCWWPSQQGSGNTANRSWTFLQNSNDYVQHVNSHIE